MQDENDDEDVLGHELRDPGDPTGTETDVNEVIPAEEAAMHVVDDDEQA